MLHVCGRYLRREKRVAIKRTRGSPFGRDVLYLIFDTTAFVLKSPETGDRLQNHGTGQ